MPSHYWISAARRGDRERLRAGLDLPPVLATVDAHRRLRGPYTAAGTLVRAVLRDALARRPELGPEHYIELQESTPEAAGLVPSVVKRLESFAAPGELSRYPARLHTLRLTHGLVDFVSEYLDALGGAPRTLIIEHAHEADPTDHEFIAVLLRRMAPARLAVVVETDDRPIADPPGPIAVSLSAALATYPLRLTADAPSDAPPVDEGDAVALARAYIDSDGTSDDPAELAAYAGIAPDVRAALHDARHAALAGLDEPSLRLGAVPYHAEHGSDPAGEGAAALRHAQKHCKRLGFYQSGVEYGTRGRAVLDRADDPKPWWDFTKDMAICLSAAGRAEEAHAIHDETRQLTFDPFIHMQLAYETALLYGRHYEPARRDPARARLWINLSIAMASQLEDRGERIFYSVFYRNGLALIETRVGNMDEALRLVDEGIERLDRELGAGERTMHRIGLRYNRAQVHGMSGDYERALAEYAEVMEIDDTFADHYFNRGNMLRALGRVDEAIADYEQALRISPPFPEAYYNRGDARLELGDVDGALADFDRTLDLDPDHVDARLNRAAILADVGRDDEALRDVSAGLALDAGNAHLLCLKGRLLAEHGDLDAAQEAVTAALDRAPGLAEGWALMGELAYAVDDVTAAIADLDRAMELGPTLEIRFNRAVARQAAGRFADAVADLDAVLAEGDDNDARQRREDCVRALAAHASA